MPSMVFNLGFLNFNSFILLYISFKIVNIILKLISHRILKKSIKLPSSFSSIVLILNVTLSM